ncbi:hypothetical protein [Streptomyces sp. 2P-4]|uniref:hypothetical protein n=1 Tax=Streptomyces sp. 2P-4 TaxID=2931974 RepID=UPI0025403D95|nr:hypothetical protein [Streptomyces sp. 2P-4]
MDQLTAEPTGRPDLMRLEDRLLCLRFETITSVGRGTSAGAVDVPGGDPGVLPATAPAAGPARRTHAWRVSAAPGRGYND